MKMRIDYHHKSRAEPQRAMLALEKYVNECGLESKLVGLVKMHASQIDSCAYCIDMHSKGTRALGETEQPLYALNALRETPFCSEGGTRGARGPSFRRRMSRVRCMKPCASTSAKKSCWTWFAVGGDQFPEPTGGVPTGDPGNTSTEEVACGGVVSKQPKGTPQWLVFSDRTGGLGPAGILRFPPLTR